LKKILYKKKIGDYYILIVQWKYPLAYLGMKDNLMDLNLLDLPVHGGITKECIGDQINEELNIDFFPPHYYIYGWDYGHYYDENKNYSLKEIMKNVNTAIRYLNSVIPFLSNLKF